MKHFTKLIFLLLAICLFTACKKEETKAPAKTYLLKKRTYNDASSSWGMEYTFDENNKVATYTYFSVTNPSATYTITYRRDVNGGVTRYDYTYTNGTTGYGTYQYNAAGQIAREDTYISAAGVPSYYYIYTYNAGSYELASYNGSGALQGKNVYFYTADKKNIANKKNYNSSNVLTSEVTYTYTDKPNVLNSYPESEIQKNYSGFVSQNAVATQNTSFPNGSTPNSSTYTYTTNADGYIVTSKSVYTSGTSTSTTNGTMEYIVK